MTKRRVSMVAAAAVGLATIFGSAPTLVSAQERICYELVEVWVLNPKTMEYVFVGYELWPVECPSPPP